MSLWAYLLWCSDSSLLCVYAIIAEEPMFIALQGYHAVACGVILFFGIRGTELPAAHSIKRLLQAAKRAPDLAGERQRNSPAKQEHLAGLGIDTGFGLRATRLLRGL